MADTHRFSVSVAAAVTRDDGKVLVIQRRDNGHWEPPGGVIDPGEQLLEALVREVEEETGYVITPTWLSGVYQNMERDIVAFVFAAKLQGGTASTSDESSVVDWVSPGQLAELMTEAYAVRISDALHTDRHPVVRAHDGEHLVPSARLSRTDGPGQSTDSHGVGIVYLESAPENLVPDLGLRVVAIRPDRWNGWLRPLATADAFGNFLDAWRGNDPNGSWGWATEVGDALVCSRPDDDDPADEFPKVDTLPDGRAVYDFTGWTWVEGTEV